MAQIKIKDIIKSVQDLVDDPEGSWATPDYVLPKLRIAYKDIYYRFIDYDLSFNEHVVELPGVAAGTESLEKYFEAGQPLEELLSPERLEWKQAGVDPLQYVKVERGDIKQDQENTQGVYGWEWREGIIWITPSIISIDLRIRGLFQFSELRSDDDQVNSQFDLSLSYKTASIIGKVRGNPGWKQDYSDDADKALEGLEVALIKQDQGIVRRIGSMNRKNPRHRKLNALTL